MRRLGTETAYAISDEAAALKAAGQTIFPFHIGDLNFRTAPAVTEACKAAAANGMDLTEVLPFSRHRNVSTLQIYRDRESDTQGKLAELVSKCI